MKRLSARVLCAVLAYSVKMSPVQAEESKDSGGVASLEQQKSAISAEYAAVTQKLAARQKVIDEQPAVVAAKKAAGAAASAYNDFVGNNPAYTKLVKERDAANAASAGALEKAKVADTEYPELRKQLNEVNVKRQETGRKIQEAAPETREAFKKELDGLDKQARDIEQKKSDRRTVLNAKQEVVDAAKAATTADAAYQEFVKSNVDFLKLVKERNGTGAAYNRAMGEAQTADAEYAPLRKQQEIIRAKIHDIDRQITEAAQKAKPAK